MNPIKFNQVKDKLRRAPRRWLVTGAGGFIGSNLLETLLDLNQEVVALDNFSTGQRRNWKQVEQAVGPEKWSKVTLLEEDICNSEVCTRACEGVQSVLHQAALGSVPRSIGDPLASNHNNVTGYLNVLTAAKDQGVENFVYASSSSVYGNHPELPKFEGQVGEPLSPYAVTKKINELYAAVFEKCYEIKPIGLRYFNVFGRRQDPQGAYAAVMPKWFSALLLDEEVVINGDGETSRDFCYIDNTVQANILAGTTTSDSAKGTVYNVACGKRTTLNELFHAIRNEIAKVRPEVSKIEPLYKAFRDGDVKHSLADITHIRNNLGYEPTDSVAEGLQKAAAWYIGDLQGRAND